MANYIDDAIDISGLENKTENDGTTAAGRISATEWNKLVTALETEQDNTQTLDGGLKNANDAIADKQEALVSGQNIKTINGTSLLGGGNIEVAQDGIQPDLIAGSALGVMGSAVEAKFMSRTAPMQGTAVVRAIQGNTFPVHQLWKMLATYTKYGVTVTNNGDGTYTMNGTGTLYTSMNSEANVIAGHKYLFVLRYISGSVSNEETGILQQNSNPQLMANDNISLNHNQHDDFYLSECVTSGTLRFRVLIREITYTNYTFAPFYADLTAMFGAGNEPTTWDEYNAAISENIGAIPYGWDGHQLASVKMTGLRSDGDTSIPVTTLTSNGTVIFPNGLNRVGEDYDEIKVSGDKAVAIRRTAIVDLGDLTWKHNATSGIFFAKLDGNDTGAPFAFDKSKPALMSYPYDFDSTTTNQNSLADKAYRLYGWYWNGINIKDADYSDAETFKTAMAGVKLVYALAEPVTYEIDDFTLPLAYHVGETEQVLPQNTASIQTCAPTLSVQYPQGTISEGDMRRFLTALGTAMGGTWTMTNDNGQFTFSFTAN